MAQDLDLVNVIKKLRILEGAVNERVLDKRLRDFVAQLPSNFIDLDHSDDSEPSQDTTV